MTTRAQRVEEGLSALMEATARDWFAHAMARAVLTVEECHAITRARLTAGAALASPEEPREAPTVDGIRMLVRRPCLLHAGAHTSEECALRAECQRLTAEVERLRGEMREAAKDTHDMKTRNDLIRAYEPLPAALRSSPDPEVGT